MQDLPGRRVAAFGILLLLLANACTGAPPPPTTEHPSTVSPSPPATVTPEPPPPRPPQIAVQRRSASDAPGLIFVAPKSFAGLQGPEIVDDRGRPVWFDALPPLQQAWGFRVQSYLGKPVLTWWQGGTHGDVGYGQGSTRSPTAPIG